MSIIGTIENDAISVFKEAASLVSKAKVIWLTFSSTQNRNLALKLFADAVKLVNDSTAAGQSAGLSLTLDTEVVADINTVINDAKAGNTVIKADLALLGITLK